MEKEERLEEVDLKLDAVGDGAVGLLGCPWSSESESRAGMMTLPGSEAGGSGTLGKEVMPMLLALLEELCLACSPDSALWILGRLAALLALAMVSTEVEPGSSSESGALLI